MAMNAYFAYVFTAVWLGSWKQITPDEMGGVMTDVLTSPLRDALRKEVALRQQSPAQ